MAVFSSEFCTNYPSDGFKQISAFEIRKRQMTLGIPIEKAIGPWRKLLKTILKILQQMLTKRKTAVTADTIIIRVSNIFQLFT